MIYLKDNFFRLVFLFFFALYSLVSTSRKIEGKVSGDDGVILPVATIVIMSTDSVVYASTLTDVHGLFSVDIEDSISTSSMVVSYIGYKTQKIDLTSNVSYYSVVLCRDSKTLAETTIIGKRIKRTPVGYDFSLNGSGLEKSNTATEMLSMLPMVSLNETGDKILLLGKAPVIYVNGIKVVSQTELASLQPSIIDKIKVEYLAIGENAHETGGIIRITTKRSSNGGLSGFLREGVTEMLGYGHINDWSILSMDASYKRWSFNYWTIYDHNKLIGDETNSYSLLTGKVFSSDEKTRSWERNLSNRLNINYQLSKKSELAFSQYISNDDIRNKRSSKIEEQLASGTETYSTDEQYKAPESTFSSQSVAKYFVETDTLGSCFELTADYLHVNHHLKQYFTLNNIEDPETGKSHESTDMVSSRSIWKKAYSAGSLQMGLNYQYIRHKSEYERSLNMIGHSPSTFINYYGSTAQLMYSLGLTLQYDWMKTEQSNEYSSKTDGLFLCPQVNLTWTFNKSRDTNVSLLYRRSVSTMPYDALTNYKNFTSTNHYTTGNTSLKIPTNHFFSFRFGWGSLLSLSIRYSYTKNAIYYTHNTEPGSQLTTYSKPINSKYEGNIVWAAESNVKPWKWWNLKLGTSFIQTNLSTYSTFFRGTILGQFRCYNTFNFTNTFGGSMIAHWETGTKFENYSWRPVGRFIVSLWKTMFYNRLRLSLQSQIWAKGRRATTFSDNYTSVYNNNTKTSSLTFSVTWYFKKGRKVKQRMNADNIQQYERIEESR